MSPAAWLLVAYMVGLAAVVVWSASLIRWRFRLLLTPHRLLVLLAWPMTLTATVISWLWSLRPHTIATWRIKVRSGEGEK